MLNLDQKKAIKILTKPLVVIAGPGTGKTALITEKIKFLIDEKKYDSDSILALTFTNKAAEEMSDRVKILTSKEFGAKTFHSFCLDLIEEYRKFLPLIPKDYILIEEKDQLLFFMENLDDFNLKSVEIKNNHSSICYELQSTISKLKDFGITIKDLEKLKFEDMQTKIDIFNVYLKYEQYKIKNHFIDFGDIINYICGLLNSNLNIREEISKKYNYILVDEFQDTNKIQLDIIKFLAKDNITVVGDLKQSIYSFRGANYKNLDLFKDHFKNFEQIYLKENYRSSKIVLKNINNLIKNIADEKEFLNANFSVEGYVNLFECENENSQFFSILETINKIKEKDETATIGILTRRKAELGLISNQLNQVGLKHILIDALNLFENHLIKEIILLLEIINNPREANSQLFYFLKKTGIRDETLRKISRGATLKEKSIFNVLEANDDFSEYSGENDLILNFFKSIEKLINLKCSSVKIYEVIFQSIYEFKFYQNSILSENLENISALNTFMNYVNSYSKIYKNNDFDRFLKICNLSNSLNFSFSDPFEQEQIQLMTIHQSKGKEFDYVILPYLNKGKFPSMFKSSQFKLPFDFSREEFLEEEKRLFFVAASRAKKGLELMYVKKFLQNKLDSKMSIFLECLDLEKKSNKTEFSSFNLSNSQLVENEIILKIQKFLVEKKYDLALTEINLLKSLFSKKDLTSFNGLNHPNYETYINKINGKIVSDNIIIDPLKMIYSVSQLKTYESCPQKYLYSYIYKIPSDSKHYFDFGTSVHGVLEILASKISKDKSIEMLFAKAVSLLKKSWISKGYESAAIEREYFEKGILALKNFIEQELKLKEENREIIGEEKTFLVEIEGKKIYGIIDRIDKVNGEYEILDYKTSNSMVSLDKLKSDIQLLVYAIALKDDPNMYGVYPKTMGLWYLIHDKITKLDFDETQIEIVKKEILKLIGGIESKNFIAKPSHFNCTYCDYFKICPNSLK